MMDYFDYSTIAREGGVSDSQLADLCRLVRRDFPNDDLMFELHVLRACMAVRDGLVSLDDVLRDVSPAIVR